MPPSLVTLHVEHPEGPIPRAGGEGSEENGTGSIICVKKSRVTQLTHRVLTVSPTKALVP